MALIPTFFPDCVVAISVPGDDRNRERLASGFLLGRFVKKIDEDHSEYRVYLITNRHVLEGRKTARVRFNPKGDEPARWYDLDLADSEGRQLWSSPSDVDIDVAVMPINVTRLKQDGMQFNYFRSDQHIANRAKLSQSGATEGDGVFVLGFPMGFLGGNRSYVIVRSGTIARIRDALAGHSTEFLLDAFVFPGNSGGPVVTRPELVAITGTQASGTAYLIGVVKGHVPFRDVALSQQTGKPRVIFEENSGLSAAVPIDFVEEAIEEHLLSLKS